MEERALRIVVKEVSSMRSVIGRDRQGIAPELAGFILEDFDRDSISNFNPSVHDRLTKNQRKFLVKLREVVVNNNVAGGTKGSFERYIDEFVLFLYDMAGFDDGRDLIMRPCNLVLDLGDDDFAAQADREGTRGTENRMDIVRRQTSVIEEI